MEILVVYSAPEQDYIHERRFEGRDEVEEARRFAKESRGVLIIKVPGDPLQVENFVYELPSGSRHRAY